MSSRTQTQTKAETTQVGFKMPRDLADRLQALCYIRNKGLGDLLNEAARRLVDKNTEAIDAALALRSPRSSGGE